MLIFLITQACRKDTVNYKNKGYYMKIWVDADACPGVVKNILFRAADRTRVELAMVANHPIKIPQLFFSQNFLLLFPLMLQL
jgi:hypothetical protein